MSVDDALDARPSIGIEFFTLGRYKDGHKVSEGEPLTRRRP